MATLELEALPVRVRAPQQPFRRRGQRGDVAAETNSSLFEEMCNARTVSEPEAVLVETTQVVSRDGQ